MHEHGPIEERRNTGAEMIRDAVEKNKSRLQSIINKLQTERYSRENEQIGWQEHEINELVEEAKLCMTRLKNLLGTHSGIDERATEIIEEALNKIEDPGLRAKFEEGVKDEK
jgi:phosphotransferase system IIB component